MTAFKSVFSFNDTDGSGPQAALVMGVNGLFYGTTVTGGEGGGNGTIFSFNPTSNVATTMHSFNGLEGDGRQPQAALVTGPNGLYYGTTYYGGGITDKGTIFSFNPTSSPPVETLHSFTGVDGDGMYPQAALVMGVNGLFYGTTNFGGGITDYGTIFSFNPSSSPPVETLYSFTGVDGDGIYPSAALVMGVNGVFYGTTSNGGSGDDKGTIFSFNPTSSPPVETVHSFTGLDPDGANPYAALVMGPDGIFYGTTDSGGKYAKGTIFSFNPTSSPPVETVYSFNGTDGVSPSTALVMGTDGLFYGTTYNGGSVADLGTIFSFNPTTKVLTTVHSFNGTDGANPYAALVMGPEGLFYGTTIGGGENNQGTIYSIAVPIPAPPVPPPPPTPPVPPTDSFSVDIAVKFSKPFAEWTQADTTSALAQIAATANVPGDRVILKALTSGSTILEAQVLYVATYAEALAIQNRLDVIVFTGLGGYIVIGVRIIQPVLQSNICFPAGTLVRTDQGEVAIDLLQPGKHTLGGKAIHYITQTITMDKYLIHVGKDAFGVNKPSRPTVMSKDHKIEYDWELVPVYRFLDYMDELKKVKYNGEVLYNVLLAEYGTMSVNNLRCETLDPTSPIACVYRGVAYKEVKAAKGRFKR
jgi:uncharacterized repeat protein (TIGR03803 family)